MPLLFRFIAEIGSMCRLKKSAKLNNSKVLNFDELTPVYELPNHQEYLQSSEITNSFFCVQHVVAFPGMGVWTLFSPRS